MYIVIPYNEREVFAEKVRSAIQHIYDDRKEDDRRYVERWRNKKRWWWNRKLPPDAMPPAEWLDNYPSERGERSLNYFQKIQKALLSEGHGDIYITGEEYESLIRWAR